MTELYIGLMSGTSADGIDATLVEIPSDNQTRLLGHLETPHPAEMRAAILELCQPGDNEIERLGQLDHQLGQAFAQAALQLLEQLSISPAEVTAIGSHGQTVRHRPKGSVAHPFTLQIGDPNLIASLTEITTVADFRRRDMAAGGEGAPLAPAFHQAAFGSPREKRVIANIGGIANVTDLTSHESTAGFDTGPGNALMDGWIQRHQHRTYDRDGEWARSGQINTALLQRLLAHPYFAAPPPKSTGRETFHMRWLDEQLALLATPVSAQDVQATLLELTASSLVDAVKSRIPNYDALYICGGGALNTTLMERLRHLSSKPVTSTAELGIDPQQVEGAAFGWLARQTLHRQPGNSPAATGAKKAVILGGIYPA
ncbi:anhydro-N-acetylmuramic acid kinase [Aestuariicella hydrocarbonica]|uniref:Anhydro-N-acetylmuramic acid kinase n=1 Tax=Pseudomaricurvus hydrocarbonicus TaxID=1470433 RepID=A0A9E5T4J7_9GAMM|nr:anhydro-N-acetylmuramic acid kinase [Aestuariicella hydrocarbonica]NHO68193.1 anhydro-N-acetylmuramic acid kinase [Aestuariicella hydrocarbonica]